MVKNPFITPEYSDPKITEAVNAAYNQSVIDGTAMDKNPTAETIADVVAKDTANNQELSQQADVDYVFSLAKDIVSKFYDPADFDQKQIMQQTLKRLEDPESIDEAISWVVHCLGGKRVPEENIETIWQVINDFAGAKTAEELAGLLQNGKITEGHLDQTWQIIEQVGDDKAASLIVDMIKEGMSEDDIKKAWRIIDKVGKDDTAYMFVWGVRHKTIPSTEIDKVWQFIETRGDKTTASVLASGIRYDELPSEKLKIAWEIIKQKGEQDTISEIRLAINTKLNWTLKDTHFAESIITQIKLRLKASKNN